jgi:hypothetical protein
MTCWTPCLWYTRDCTLSMLFLADTHLDTDHIKAMLSAYPTQDTVSYCITCKESVRRRRREPSALNHLQARLFHYWQDEPLAKVEEDGYCPSIEH